MKVDINRISPLPGQTVVIPDVSIDELEQFLKETGDDRRSRIAYHNGVLEIMTPSLPHEKASELLGHLVNVFFEEIDVDWEAIGSTTLGIEDRLEPDKGFYFGKYSESISSKDEIDLSVDPPPDLAIEADKTSGSINKLKDIYPQLKILEVWRYDVKNSKLEIHRLKDGKYSEVKASLYFPDKVITKMEECVLKRQYEGTRLKTVTKEFRAWTRELDGKENLKEQVEGNLDKTFARYEKSVATKEDTKQNTLDAIKNTSKDLSVEDRLRKAIARNKGGNPGAVKEEPEKSKSKSKDFGRGR